MKKNKVDKGIKDRPSYTKGMFETVGDKYCPRCQNMVRKVYSKRGFQEKVCWKCHQELDERQHTAEFLQRRNHGHH